MSVLNNLASALNRRDEVSNQELAEKLVRAHDRAAVKELVENLHNKDMRVQCDCIKVLYEIGTAFPR